MAEALRFCLFRILIGSIVSAMLASLGTRGQSFDERDVGREAEAAMAHWNRESYERSAQLYSIASKIQKKGGNASNQAEDLRAAARVNNILGNYDFAKQQLTTALSIDRRLNDNVGRVKTLSILSDISLKSGDVSIAGKLANQAVKLARELDDSVANSWALAALADLEYSQFRLPECLEHAAEALESSRSLGDTEKQIEILQQIGYVYAGLNQPLKGMAAVEEAIGLAVARSDIRAEALSRFEAGFMFLLTNQPQKALEACRQAERLFPDDLDLIDKARLLNGIASVYAIYGDWDSALNYSRNALDVFGRANYAKGELATLVTLIDLNFRIGDERAAMDAFQRAEQLSGALHDDFYLATAYSNLADHYSSKAENPEAERLYRKSLEIFSKVNYARGLSSVRSSLGELYLRWGSRDEARQYLESALSISRDIKDTLGETRAAYDLARLAHDEGNVDHAIELLETVVAADGSLAAKISNSQLRLGFLGNSFDRNGFYISLLMGRNSAGSDPASITKALQVAERSRAQVIVENISLAGTEFRRDAAPEVVERENAIRIQLNAHADRLTNLLSRNAENPEIETVSAEIRKLENELEEIRADLKESSPFYSGIKDPPQFDPGEFQRDVLDENSVLLEYSLGEDESFLWLVDKAGVSSFALPAGAEVERRIEDLLRDLKAREAMSGENVEDYQARVANADADYRVEARQLSHILLGPVADKIRGKRLIFVPDGKLLYLPFSALPLPDAVDDEPLLLSNEVVYEPSAQTLSLLARNRGKAAAAAKDLLVFSDPVFSLDDPRLAGREIATSENDPSDRFRFVESLKNLQRLPGSGAEASSITSSLGGATDSFSGFAATRDRLLATDLANYKIIHFATHALTDENRPELSGVVLSRYDQDGRPQNEFVRLNDIYGMNLKADLVVLSACETGAGKEVKGEGLISLNNAFLQVGAKSVLATVWKAEDGASQTLMKEFYSGIAAGMTPSKALQQAQVKLWKMPQYKSPFFWAAFTLHGDPLARPQVSRAFDRRFYLAGLAPLALLAVYIGWRRRKNYSTAKS